MGDSPSNSNPNSTAVAATSTSTMTSLNSSETSKAGPENEPTLPPKSPDSESPIQGSIENPAETPTGKALEDPIEGENGDEEGEEEGECGFCLFMKAGGCKDTFTDWEKCVEEGEKNKEDIVEKCFQATAALKMCMEAHSDYYAPLLQAEKAAEEEAAKQLEEEKVKLNSAGDELSGKKEKETS